MIDSRHDLALVTYESPRRPTPLQAESALPSVGEPVALIGIPVLSQDPLSGLQRTTTSATRAVVTATNEIQDLTSADGVRHTLTDVIRVTAPGVLNGESGGPAINAAGKVVGVIVGSGSGVATLAPVAALTSLH
jgi:S1-C subfamily serine protease